MKILLFFFLESSLWIRKFCIVLLFCNENCSCKSRNVLGFQINDYMFYLRDVFDGIECVCICIFMFWHVGCGYWTKCIPERDAQNICSCFWRMDGLLSYSMTVIYTHFLCSSQLVHKEMKRESTDVAFSGLPLPLKHTFINHTYSWDCRQLFYFVCTDREMWLMERNDCLYCINID